MLIPFWFRTKKGFGYGVTAASRSEAEAMLQSFGYPRDDEVVTEVIEGIRHADLDQNHVAPNAGPLVVRGVWFPLHNL